MRQLIVNADDFGQSAGISRGVLKAHRYGIVTSASVMVRYDAASDAVRQGQHAGLDLGLHIDLGEWKYEAGSWQPIYEVTSVDDSAAVDDEVRRQFRRFIDMAGVPPSHVDSHQHVHRRESVRQVVLDAAAEHHVPVRDYSAVRYVGDFYGQTEEGDALPRNITVTRLQALIRGLPRGVTEIGCHPGVKPLGITTMYDDERVEELETLCDPALRETIREQGIRLTTFVECAAMNRGSATKVRE